MSARSFLPRLARCSSRDHAYTLTVAVKQGECIYKLMATRQHSSSKSERLESLTLTLLCPWHPAAAVETLGSGARARSLPQLAGPAPSPCPSRSA
jgi:hypothetical protein